MANIKVLIENAETMLPELCYSINQVSGEIIIIKRGMKGYFATDYGFTGVRAEETVHICNERLGVTPEQRMAMEVGSMCHWKERDEPGG